jgi:beta-ureidopropionase / N-carbamoyl-L-amino-acid hydrolase
LIAFPEPDIALAARLFDVLRERSFDGIGISRDSYGPGEQMAHDLLREHGTALGLEPEVDFAGNLYLTLPGRDRALPRAMLGSHLDSVPQGGNFDGAAGVLAGLAVLAGFVREGVQPARDITLMAIRAEETPWFPFSFVGSRAALGTLPRDLPDQIKRNDTGRTLAEHMQDLGFNPQPIRDGRAHLDPKRIACFLELHIEQGPVLVAEGLPVAVVNGINGGIKLHRCTLHPAEEAKPGAARWAFIAFAQQLEAAWIAEETAGRQITMTFCTFAAESDIVRFSLDVRSASDATIATMRAHLGRIAAAIEAERRVRFEFGTDASIPAGPVDAGITHGLLATAERLGLAPRAMVSGGGHDAAIFGAAGVPNGMIFIRNAHGSHNPAEAMEIADFAQGTRLVAAYLAEALA